MSERSAELIPVSLDADPTIDAYKEGVDRTLLREHLKLTTAQRVEKMISTLRFAEAVRGSRRLPDSKTLLSIRYSREVVEYFKATGVGWQTRMDEALKEWVNSHRS